MTRRGNPNWVKGGPSGNPGGRPKVAAELRERCLKAVDEIVLDYWIDEVASKGPNAARCSELLAAYGLGKPAQRLEHAGTEDGPVGLEVRFVKPAKDG